MKRTRIAGVEVVERTRIADLHSCVTGCVAMHASSCTRNVIRSGLEQKPSR